MIVRHQTKDTDQNSVNGATVVTGSYNVDVNKLGRVRVLATIYDTVALANIGIGEFVIAFHRYGGNAVIDSTDAVIPLKTPGTLNGATVGVSASGPTITTTFTGVVGRTIRVIASFELTTIQD